MFIEGLGDTCFARVAGGGGGLEKQPMALRSSISDLNSDHASRKPGKSFFLVLQETSNVMLDWFSVSLGESRHEEGRKAMVRSLVIFKVCWCDTTSQTYTHTGRVLGAGNYFRERLAHVAYPRLHAH
jgi:hypothetical protein